jgi:hypothetical protein
MVCRILFSLAKGGVVKGRGTEVWVGLGVDVRFWLIRKVFLV